MSEASEASVVSIQAVQNANNRLQEAYTIWVQSNREDLLRTVTPLIDFNLPAVKKQINLHKLNALEDSFNKTMFLKNPYVNSCQFYDLVENMIYATVEELGDHAANLNPQESVEKKLTQLESLIKTSASHLFNQLEDQDTESIRKLKEELKPLKSYSPHLFAGKKKDCLTEKVEEPDEAIQDGINELRAYLKGGTQVNPMKALWKIYHNYYLLMILKTCYALNQPR